MGYNPVDDYKRQRGSKLIDLKPAEEELLNTLTREEVAALVSIDTKARALGLEIDTKSGVIPLSPGAHSY